MTVVTLPPKTATRLLGLYVGYLGAKQAAQAAVAVADAAQAKWQEAVATALEAEDVPEGANVNHDADKGTITITPAGP